MRAAVDIDGLPDPSTLGGGGHRAYVAWLTTLTMSHETRLGEVKNGHTELGTIDLLQYRVVISAEASADVKERRGRLVLRATSPSSRLLVHRDMLSPAAPGALRDAPSAGVSVIGGRPADPRRRRARIITPRRRRRRTSTARAGRCRR